jgi:hypothetical protein
MVANSHSALRAPLDGLLLALDTNAFRKISSQVAELFPQGRSVLRLFAPSFPRGLSRTPGAGIHRSQGPNSLSIALHGDWIPVFPTGMTILCLCLKGLSIRTNLPWLFPLKVLFLEKPLRFLSRHFGV